MRLRLLKKTFLPDKRIKTIKARQIVFPINLMVIFNEQLGLRIKSVGIGEQK